MSPKKWIPTILIKIGYGITPTFKLFLDYVIHSYQVTGNHYTMAPFMLDSQTITVQKEMRLNHMH